MCFFSLQTIFFSFSYKFSTIRNAIKMVDHKPFEFITRVLNTVEAVNDNLYESTPPACGMFKRFIFCHAIAAVNQNDPIFLLCLCSLK